MFVISQGFHWYPISIGFHVKRSGQDHSKSVFLRNYDRYHQYEVRQMVRIYAVTPPEVDVGDVEGGDDAGDYDEVRPGDSEETVTAASCGGSSDTVGGEEGGADAASPSEGAAAGEDAAASPAASSDTVAGEEGGADAASPAEEAAAGDDAAASPAGGSGDSEGPMFDAVVGSRHAWWRPPAWRPRDGAAAEANAEADDVFLEKLDDSSGNEADGDSPASKDEGEDISPTAVRYRRRRWH